MSDTLLVSHHGILVVPRYGSHGPLLKIGLGYQLRAPLLEFDQLVPLLEGRNLLVHWVRELVGCRGDDWHVDRCGGAQLVGRGGRGLVHVHEALSEDPLQTKYQMVQPNGGFLFERNSSVCLLF